MAQGFWVFRFCFVTHQPPPVGGLWPVDEEAANNWHACSGKLTTKPQMAEGRQANHNQDCAACVVIPKISAYSFADPGTAHASQAAASWKEISEGAAILQIHPKGHPGPEHLIRVVCRTRRG